MDSEYEDGGGVLSEEGLVDYGDVGQAIIVRIVGGRISYGGYFYLLRRTGDGLAGKWVLGALESIS